jgi:hypothetical protein
MDESNDVTNTAHLMIFILGSEGGFLDHEEVDSLCNMTGPAVCGRFVHESKVCYLELGRDRLTRVTREMVHVCIAS